MLTQRLHQALDPVYIIDYDDVQGIDLDQTPADVAVFQVPFNCVVVRAQAVVTEVCAGSATTPIVKFDLRPTAGTDTDRGDGDIAEFNFGTSALGTVLYDAVAAGTVLNAGEEVVVQITQKASGTPTGHFRPLLLVSYDPETLANMTNLSATT